MATHLSLVLPVCRRRIINLEIVILDTSNWSATAFFKQAINNNGFPDKVVMDKSGANYAG
jgi:transposase-like protein